MLAIQHRFGNVQLLRPFTTTKSPKNIAVVPRGVTGQMAFGPRGAYLATSQRDAVTVWDTETHQVRWKYPVPVGLRFARTANGWPPMDSTALSKYGTWSDGDPRFRSIAAAASRSGHLATAPMEATWLC